MRDGKEKPGRAGMVVEALAAVLSVDGVVEDAVVVTLVAEDLGRIVTTLLGAGSNDAAVLEARPARPPAHACALAKARPARLPAHAPAPAGIELQRTESSYIGRNRRGEEYFFPVLMTCGP
jgi:hypothetical protein